MPVNLTACFVVQSCYNSVLRERSFERSHQVIAQPMISDIELRQHVTGSILNALDGRELLQDRRRDRPADTWDGTPAPTRQSIRLQPRWGLWRGDTHRIARRVTCLTALNLSCPGFSLGARRFTGGGGLALVTFLTGGGGSASSHELESPSLATTAIVEPHAVQ